MISKLKIGGMIYHIVTMPNLFGKDNEIICGMFVSNDAEILLSDKLSFPQAESTILHETLHAIAWMAGVEAPESAIMALESGLYQVLVDNPKFTQMFIDRHNEIKEC